MARLRNPSLIAATFLIATGAVLPARATAPPADACSLLPASDISKTLGQAFDAPQSSVAPRPFANTVTGTDCGYPSKGAGHGTLLFRIYFDPSTTAAADLFTRLSKFYGTPMPVNGLGDVAYFDAAHGLHVRKGNVRFFLTLDTTGPFTPALQQQLQDLASQVSSRL
jgi:hypothetical protein